MFRFDLSFISSSFVLEIFPVRRTLCSVRSSRGVSGGGGHEFWATRGAGSRRVRELDLARKNTYIALARGVPCRAARGCYCGEPGMHAQLLSSTRLARTSMSGSARWPAWVHTRARHRQPQPCRIAEYKKVTLFAAKLLCPVEPPSVQADYRPTCDLLLFPAPAWLGSWRFSRRRVCSHLRKMITNM